MQPVKIQLSLWAGAWGPFKIKIPCGECSLTRDVQQIWLDGHYIGGADELQQHIDEKVEPNLERGQCSLSPGGANETNA